MRRTWASLLGGDRPLGGRSRFWNRSGGRSWGPGGPTRAAACHSDGPRDPGGRSSIHRARRANRLPMVYDGSAPGFSGGADDLEAGHLKAASRESCGSVARTDLPWAAFGGSKRHLQNLQEVPSSRARTLTGFSQVRVPSRRPPPNVPMQKFPCGTTYPFRRSWKFKRTFAPSICNAEQCMNFLEPVSVAAGAGPTACHDGRLSPRSTAVTRSASGMLRDSNA